MSDVNYANINKKSFALKSILILCLYGLKKLDISHLR